MSWERELAAGVTLVAVGGVLLVCWLPFSPVPLGMMMVSMFGRRKQETTMTDQPMDDQTPPPEGDDENINLAAWKQGDPVFVRDFPPVPQHDPDDTVIQESRWRAEGIPDAGGRAKLAARAAVPRSIVSPHREQCSHCGGTGYMAGINDHLHASAELIGARGDDVVRSFYTVLFRTAPDVAKLFPGDPTQGDLGTDHRGVKQREKLLAAVLALADLYDPDNPEKMARLDTALKVFGRSHAAFARQDGTVKGATWEEYAAVKDALFGALVRAAGESWKPEYTESWSQAYDYAAAVMMTEQFRSGFAAPRFPRA